jgi:hypothetical protein
MEMKRNFDLEKQDQHYKQSTSKWLLLLQENLNATFSVLWVVTCLSMAECVNNGAFTNVSNGTNYSGLLQIHWWNNNAPANLMVIL